jgi:transposase, IS5 family
MAVKQSGQFSFVDALLPQGIGRNDRLDRLSGLVKWYRFEKILARLRDEGGAGRPSYSPLLMFKALLLQSLYGLSDAELEDAISDRWSFRRFVGLSVEASVPDHTTLCRFRNLLTEAGRRGTMLDATIIETTAPRPPHASREGASQVPASDPDAAFTRKQGKQGSSYGYKAHAGVDQGSGLIRKIITTPANINDTTPADLLICGDERAVLADAAYHTHARERALKDKGIKPRLMRRPNKHHPELPPRLKRFNQLISRQRAAVETTFATLKRRMGLSVIRYRGLAKATAQVTIAAIAFNMRRWVTLTS